MKNNIVLRPSYWASVSGGKDSLYMLKLVLEHPDEYPLDGVVHYELEIDYPFIKNVIDYMEQQCKSKGIKFVRIKPQKQWYDLYKENGYPSRKGRWCNSQYKLNCKKQLQQFLKSQGCFLVNYIGFCADEEKRFKYVTSKDGIPLQVYPLAEYDIEESTILQWARTQPIFNDYYKYNKRCGCMCCPLSSIDNLVYTKKYYPKEYNYFMNLALEHEKRMAKKYGREKFSVWQSNPKYDTEYIMKRVDEEINGTYDFNKKGTNELWKII